MGPLWPQMAQSTAFQLRRRRFCELILIVIALKSLETPCRDDGNGMAASWVLMAASMVCPITPTAC
ncbi:unnamed protein product [Symbiodinium pilosum]|uniref:Uncharacterized protein n=1 Tax=Symbiodinium pilosum TaxID=2952 RepID=A0A812LVL9_SYMPI|nr:unnamed protein product [Symbiodinium pilosum]